MSALPAWNCSLKKGFLSPLLQEHKRNILLWEIVQNQQYTVDIKIRQAGRVFSYNKGTGKLGGLILLLSPPQT